MPTTKTLLLVEDSPGDVRLTREAFHEANTSVHVQVAADGIEALAYLKREEKHAHSPVPDLIVLDLNLPRMNGHEVLKYIKADDALKVIPTIILTTSEAEADVTACYELQANAFITKPIQFGEFEVLIQAINDFWLSRVKLPTQE